jgi:hypothetical protein
LIPVAEFVVVQDAQVNFVTEQLSAVTGFVEATPWYKHHPTFGVKFVGQEVKVGLILSVTITVYEQLRCFCI